MTPCAAGLDSPIEEMAHPRPELLAHVPPACTFSEIVRCIPVSTVPSNRKDIQPCSRPFHAKVPGMQQGMQCSMLQRLTVSRTSPAG